MPEFTHTLDADGHRQMTSFATVHAPDCNGGCGGTFLCPWCEREMGYCCGAYDETPALCDDCFMRLETP